jgi:5-methylcytosine-specific restriction endonuclease McrA
MLRKPGSSDPRRDNDYKKFRLQVLKRDGYRCQFPGCGSKRKLQVHHIIRYADSKSNRLNPNNGICLCRNCHKLITGRERYYQTLFFGIVDKNNKKGKQ